MARAARWLAMLVVGALMACGGNGSGGNGKGPPPLPTPEAPPPGTLADGRFNELLDWARNSQQAPAMAAIVVRRGHVVEKGAVGLRSAAASVEVTTQDRWHIGSITKSMTATLAAMLVEDGLIAWDTRPLDVWPELASRIDAGFHDITLRQLLSHSSGMKRDDDFGPAANGSSGTLMQKRRAWAEELLSRRPEFTAGTFSYSNVGYVVAAAMLETRAQTPYETLLRTRLFAPLGMDNSGFGTPGTPGAIDQPLGHTSRAAGFDPVQPTATNEDILAITPAGLVHVTLDDFAAYLQAHLAGERGASGILTTESWQRLHTQVLTPYALGWEISPSLSGLEVAGFGHNGSNNRWFAATWVAPSLDTAAFIVVNGGGERAKAAVAAFDLLLRRRVTASP